jgi:hypothetical protein
MTQNRQTPGYSGWQWLNLDANEAKDVSFLQASFQQALQQSGFAADTLKNLTVGVEKASLTISPDEARSGAGHMLADGQPFYRMTLSSGTSMFRPTEALQTLMILVQYYGANGGSSMQMGDPVTVTHDFRGDLLTKAAELSNITPVVATYVVKPAPKSPNPPSP